MITSLSLMVVAYAWAHFNMMEVETSPELKGHLKAPDPFLYCMYNEDGSVIIEEIDLSDLDSVKTVQKKQTLKVCDIVQGQYWVECMQMQDIISATRVIGLQQPR